jgi:hypothetical protein
VSLVSSALVRFNLNRYLPSRDKIPDTLENLQCTPAKRGRPPKISDNGIDQLKQMITDKTLAIESLTTGPGGSFDETLMNIMKSENPNSNAEIKYSPETRRKIMKRLNVVKTKAHPNTEYHRMRSEDKSSIILNKQWRQEYNAGRSQPQHSRYKCVNGCVNGTNVVRCNTPGCKFRVCQAEACQAMLQAHGVISNHKVNVESLEIS